MKKTTFSLIAAGLIFIGFFSYWSMRSVAGRQQQDGGHYLRFEDSYHRVITLDTIPARVVSLAPNITEIVFALGKGGALVGRTDYCDYPAEAGEIQSVGSITNPNIEKIVQLNPDIVIASTHFQKAVLTKLESLGITVAVLDGEDSFDGVYQTIEQVGKVLHSEEAAAELISEMKQKVADITSKVRNACKPKVYYVVFYGDSGFYTAGEGTFIGNMLNMAGAENAAGDFKGWQYSLEKLVEKNPDLLVCSKFYHTKEAIGGAPGFKDLKAVKEGKILEIDHNLLDRQGPRLVEGLEALARLFHPEIFGDYQME